MSNIKTRWWNRYIPAYARNPFGLAYRLLASENAAARSALFMAAGGLALTPLDILLRPFENRLYARAESCSMPIILVVGPPRSGTTLVAQYLINSFEVCYLNNLTSLFPRSPIQANRLFGRLAPLARGDYSSYYGKSRSLSGSNDGLYIWDRWLGADREAVPSQLANDAAGRMPRFFAALQEFYGLPVINKVNRLNTCADLVAEVLNTAYFICLHRDPVYLAQSLYIARQEILGQLGTPYGTRHLDSVETDPVEDVCRQVSFHQAQAQKQQELLGESRFSIISYEDFCSRPGDFAASLSRQHPTLRPGSRGEQGDLTFRVSRKNKLPEAIMRRIQNRLAELEKPPISFRSF